MRRLAAELLAGTQSADDLEAVLATQAGHATVKVDVRGFCRDGNRVLLVRERSDGRWCLPGGWAEPELPPSAAVEKEVREEAGLAVRATRLLGVLDRDLQPEAPPHPFRIYKLFFACAIDAEVDRGEGPASRETTAVDWFAADDLPPLSLGRTTPPQIARLFAITDDPCAAPVFD